MITREGCREEIASFLRGKLGSVVAEIYSYKAMDPKGRSPVLVVGSAGTWPGQMTAANYWTRYYFAINLLVVHTQPVSSAAATWTEKDAESQLDALSALVIEALFQARTSAHWRDLTVYDRTFVDEVRIGGIDYLVETILLQVEV